MYLESLGEGTVTVANILRRPTGNYNAGIQGLELVMFAGERKAELRASKLRFFLSSVILTVRPLSHLLTSHFFV